MKEITTQLKKFRTIEPTETFRNKTLGLILQNRSRQAPDSAWVHRTPVFSWGWLWAPALASIILAVAVGGRLLSIKPALSSFNAEGLRSEFNGLDINIELKEISYRQEVSQEIASAIMEIGNNRTRHLSPSLLESEASNLNLDAEGGSQIDELLDQLTL